MTGIYKIESPNGKIYIGQSVDIAKRWLLYKGIKDAKKQPLLERSIIKHGYDNHKFSVVHELPFDVSKEVLTEYERIYMDAYREAGFIMLNIYAARNSVHGYKRPAEQIKRFSEIMKGRTTWMKGKKHTEETKAIIKEKRKLQKNVVGRPIGHIPWNKGKKTGSTRKGFKHSDETKEKLRGISTGKKLSPQTIAKRTATMQANLKIKPRKDWSDEAKQRQSQRYLGTKRSPETLLKGRQTRLLKIS